MENVTILRKWEQLEKKIADFMNHRRFTLRCLSQKITPNSLKLKSNIKTSRGKRKLEKVERQLANERARNINNTIATCTCLRDTCIDELKDQISNSYFQECAKFIERIRETRHQTVLKRHLSKFDQLWQRFRGHCSKQETTNGHPNIRHRVQEETSPAKVTDTTSTEVSPATTSTTTTDTTTKNISIDGSGISWAHHQQRAQVSLLVHGPNFTVAPRHPPWGLHHCDWASLLEVRAPQCRRA